MHLGLVHYLTVSAVLFGLGLLTVMTRRNTVGILLGVELLLNAAALNFIAFEHFVADRPEVMECYSMSGEWDYLLRVVVADVADYERFLMRDLLAHPRVATASSHFALGQVKYTTALPI